MAELIIAVYQYPWTSVFVFVGLWILANIVLVTVETIFNKKIK